MEINLNYISWYMSYAELETILFIITYLFLLFEIDSGIKTTIWIFSRFRIEEL